MANVDPTAGFSRLQLTGHPILPIPGESLRSVVARTCFENGLPNSFGLLGPLGLLNRNRVRVSEGDDIPDADLAYAMKLKTEDVASRKYAALELGYLDFFGLQVNRMRVNNTIRRFAPAAMDTAPHHRAVWELRDLSFCLETWDMLRDTCPCPTEEGPTVQRWTRTGSRVSECDKCGHPLHVLPRQLVPEDLRVDLEVLRELLSPELGNRRNLGRFLPGPIALTDRGRLFDCLRLMSEIAVGGSLDGLDPGFADTVLRWHQACLALRAWPNAFPGDWIDEAVASGAYSDRRDIYLDLANEPTTTLVEVKTMTRSRGPLVQPRDKSSETETDPTVLAAQRKEMKARNRRKRIEEITARKIGLRPASEAAKLDPETLLRAQEEGMLGKFERRHGPRSLPAFDRDEVIEFGKRWNARIPVAKVAYYLGISHHGVEQLVVINAMTARAPRFENEGPHFTQQDIDDLLELLLAGSSDKEIEWVRLQEAMRLIDDRPKPWGPVLALMLSGELDYRIPAKFNGALPTLQVPLSTASSIAKLRFESDQHPTAFFAPFMVQRDVCELFNVLETKFEAVHFLPSSGSIPRIYDRELVEAKRLELISHNELARRFSTNWRDVRSRLSAAGLEPILGNFYVREEAMIALTTKRN